MTQIVMELLYVDFQICGIIIVELKVAEKVYQKHFSEVLAYSKTKTYSLV